METKLETENQIYRNCKTQIYEIDLDGCVQYWAFAENPADALTVLVNTQGEWLDERSTTVTITWLDKEAAGSVMIRRDCDTFKGIDEDTGLIPLWDIHCEQPERAIIACSEW